MGNFYVCLSQQSIFQTLMSSEILSVTSLMKCKIIMCLDFEENNIFLLNHSVRCIAVEK